MTWFPGRFPEVLRQVLDSVLLIFRGRAPLRSWNPAWTRKEKGRWGERAAVEFLLSRGHRILALNYVSKGGEIDVVTDDRGTLVFVEVKTRFEPGRNPPLLAVDDEKMIRLRRAARHYLRRIRPPLPPARIDLVGVVPHPETGKPLIRYEKDVARLQSPPAPAAAQSR